jgi:hypothetical protein
VLDGDLFWRPRVGERSSVAAKPEASSTVSIAAFGLRGRGREELVCITGGEVQELEEGAPQVRCYLRRVSRRERRAAFTSTSATAATVGVRRCELYRVVRFACIEVQ